MLGNLTYEYDKAGNRTKIGGSFARTGIPEAVNNTAYNAANQQTTFGNKTLTYDNNGNLTSITDANGTTLYSWNARNQLSGISGPNVNASFVYDGVGRREKKTINGNLTEFLYDGVNPVQETSGATVLANILAGLGIDEFFTRTDVGAGTTSTLLSDALGSTIALTDSAGTIQTENTYEPFGRTTATGMSNTNPFQYTGRENDGTGLYYYRARYYHPQLQRFVSEDPIEFSGGDINLYGYVINNPVKYTDPHGLCFSPGLATVCKEIFGKVVAEAIIGLVDNFRKMANQPRDYPMNDAVKELTEDHDRDGTPNALDPDHPLCSKLGNCPPHLHHLRHHRHVLGENATEDSFSKYGSL